VLLLAFLVVIAEDPSIKAAVLALPRGLWLRCRNECDTTWGFRRARISWAIAPQGPPGLSTKIVAGGSLLSCQQLNAESQESSQS